MPLRYFKCPACGHETETLRNKTPKCNHGQEEEGMPFPLSEMEEVLVPPNTKLMETVDPVTGRKRVKNQQKALLERARNYSRDKEIDELIQMNKDNELTGKQFLNKDGKRRTKLDDI